MVGKSKGIAEAGAGEAAILPDPWPPSRPTIVGIGTSASLRAGEFLFFFRLSVLLDFGNYGARVLDRVGVSAFELGVGEGNAPQRLDELPLLLGRAVARELLQQLAERHSELERLLGDAHDDGGCFLVKVEGATNAALERAVLVLPALQVGADDGHHQHRRGELEPPARDRRRAARLGPRPAAVDELVDLADQLALQRFVH